MKIEIGSEHVKKLNLINFKEIGFSSKIIFYHQAILEKLIQIYKEYDADLNLNKFNDLVENVNWKYDRDLESINSGESGTFC